MRSERRIKKRRIHYNQISVESDHTEFNGDGSITTVSASSTKETTFDENGNISQTVVFNNDDGSSTTLIQDTVFNSDGSIDNLVSTSTSNGEEEDING